MSRSHLLQWNRLRVPPTYFGTSPELTEDPDVERPLPEFPGLCGDFCI